jgi:hypothetical protein
MHKETIGKILICSDCFKDEGLKLDAFKIGIANSQICKNCKSKKGNKLTKELVLALCDRFFVRGSIRKCDFGGYPVIMYNNHHYNNSDIDLSPWLRRFQIN